MAERVTERNVSKQFNLEKELFLVWGQQEDGGNSLKKGAMACAAYIRLMPFFDDENVMLGVSGHKLSPREVVEGLTNYAKAQNLQNLSIKTPFAQLDAPLEAAVLDAFIQTGVEKKEFADQFKARIDQLTPIITKDDPKPITVDLIARNTSNVAKGAVGILRNEFSETGEMLKVMGAEVVHIAHKKAESLRDGIIGTAQTAKKIGPEIARGVRESAKQIKEQKVMRANEKLTKEERRTASEHFVEELSRSMPVYDSVYHDGGFDHPRTEFHASIKNLITKGWFTEIKFSDWRAAVLSRPQNPVIFDIRLKGGRTVHLDSSVLEQNLPTSKDQMVPFESVLYAVSKSEAQLRSAINASDVAYRLGYEREAEKGVDAISAKVMPDGEFEMDFEKLKLAALKDIRNALIDGEIAKAKPGLNLTLDDLEKHTEKYLTSKGLTEAALAATLIIAFVLASCGPIQPQSTEASPAQPTVVLASPTPGTEVPVAIASPTLAPAVDLGDVNGSEFSFDSLNPFNTYVVITDNGLSQARFGLSPDQLSADQQTSLSGLEVSITGQIADAIKKNPGYEKYYIPEFINVDDLKNSLGDQADDFNLIPFSDLSGSTRFDDGLLMSVHLGGGGWDVIGWEDFKMGQINGVYYVDGLMRLGINEDSDPAYERYEFVRGQRLGDDVLGAFPVITEAGRFVVKVDVNGTVIEIMSNDGFASGVDNPWQRDVLEELSSKNIPGVSIVGENVVITVNADESLTIPLDNVSERIHIAENGAYLIKSENGKENIAIFDSNLKTERWGAGKAWITRGEAVKLTHFTNTNPETFQNSDYEHDNIVEIPEGDWDALDEALYLGSVFAPSFSDNVTGVDPTQTNVDTFDDITVRPLGYRSGPEQNPIKFHNNVLFSFRNGSGVLFYVSIQQEAVKNLDGTVSVLGFDVTRTDKDLAIALTLSGRMGGDANDSGNYGFPTLNQIPVNEGTSFERENFKRLGLVDRNRNIDPEVKDAIRTWLTTGQLPDTIKGVPIEKIIFGMIPYNIVQGGN